MECTHNIICISANVTPPTSENKNNRIQKLGIVEYFDDVQSNLKQFDVIRKALYYVKSSKFNAFIEHNTVRNKVHRGMKNTSKHKLIYLVAFSAHCQDEING